MQTSLYIVCLQALQLTDANTLVVCIWLQCKVHCNTALAAWRQGFDSSMTLCMCWQVSAMLILGGAAVMTALTGMNLYAACMLIPFTVILCKPLARTPLLCSLETFPDFIRHL